MYHHLTPKEMVYSESTTRQSESVSFQDRLDQGIAVILCVLVLVNIGLWITRLCFHTSALVE